MLIPTRLATIAAILFYLLTSRAEACLTPDDIPKFNDHGTVELDKSVIRRRVYERASALFIGRVVSLQRIKPGAGSSDDQLVEASIDVIEVLKGEPPSDRKVLSGTSMCDALLSIGTVFLFALHVDDGNRVTWPMGTGSISDLTDPAVLAILQNIRHPHRHPR